MLAYAVLAVAYILSQFYRSFLAVLAKLLETDVGASAGDLSFASGAWYIAFALMQFPVGYALDTFGPRRTASVLLAIGGTGGMALFAVATNPFHVTAAMVLVGIGCSPVLMASFYLYARTRPAAGFATFASTFIAFGMLGNIAGAAPLAYSAQSLGWRTVAVMLSVATAAVSLAIFATVRDPARMAQAKGEGGTMALFKIPALWPIFPLILIGASAVTSLRGLWSGPLFTDVYGLDTAAAGNAILVFAIAISLGTLAYGPLDRMLNSRKRVIMGGNLALLAMLVVLTFALPGSVFAMTACLCVVGFFGASYSVQIAHGRAFVPEHLTGRGVTLMNFFAIGGSGLVQFISGFVVEAARSPDNPAAAYQALFAFYAATTLAAVIAYAFSTDARPGGGMGAKVVP
jgi:predicted MFS family arabinose efflux permease